MKQLLVSIWLLALATGMQAQQERGEAEDSSWRDDYRESAPRINDLVNTKLDVRFDYDKSYMYGKAWITLQPHFYPTDSLTLDAKGMDINTVALVSGGRNQPLQYTYDSMQLRIDLGKMYKRNDKYTVYIDYTAKPNEVKVQGSAAITDAKGLYFINPKGEEKDKATQIWTQGETEATSVWCPTIDKPNQRTTDEITMTVPAKYVSLSNGKLVSQKKNSDGTRTDTWKMDLPHAPYLFFMGVGDYAVIKDQYKGKEVNYYVEKEYAPVARKIFGHTPEMMAFYSKLLGVEYPWNKYAQITAQDYVSGAMENTTATLHSSAAQQDARQLVDDNAWEGTIAHELFHQWFGDLVTTESWSNLTLNESFANYSQVLWKQYKYGKDAGDEENYSDMAGYLQSKSDNKNLVRFYYPDKEAMFDAVSYNKGGRILHMLRNYVGDSAFFKALNVYLTKNKFQSAEAHQLRLAFEEVTGKDLNWFWNQWYFGNGHPVLQINYVYDDNAKKVSVIVKQTQAGKPFRLPIAVDIYTGGKKERHNAWLQHKTDTLAFAYTSRPDLVNVDGDKVLLVEKTDSKTLANFIYQYEHTGLFMDRKEAIDFAAASEDPKAVTFMTTALKDKFPGLRTYALEHLDMKNAALRTAVQPVLLELAKNDPKPLVRAAALEMLAPYGDAQYKDLFVKSLNDSSYSVAGAALEGLLLVDSNAALTAAKSMSSKPMKGKVIESVTHVLMTSGDVGSFDAIADAFEDLPTGQAKFNLVQPLTQLLARLNDTEKLKRGVDLIVEFRDAIPPQYGIAPYINDMLGKVVSQKQSFSSQPGANEQAEYIRSKIGK